MQPTRAGKPLRNQQPFRRQLNRHTGSLTSRDPNQYPDRHPHEHQRRSPTSLESFWTAYSVTRNDGDNVFVEQSRKFWIAYSLTRDNDDIDLAERSRRVGIRCAEQDSRHRFENLSPQCTAFQTQHGLSISQRARTAYRSFVGTLSTITRVVRGGIVKIASGTKIHGVSAARLCRTYWKTLAILAIPLTICLIRANYLAALRQDSVPSLPLTKYHEFPTWMHTDPLQVLGFPSAVSPFFFSSPLKDNITYKYKKFRLAWWPAKWRQHNFTNYRTAELAFLRGEAAKDIFDNWYKNPWCIEDVSSLYERHLRNPRFAYNDGLPSFRNPCRCTLLAYVAKHLRTALIPYFWQSTVPQTDQELQYYCPCTKTDAHASWRTFVQSKQPPFLPRIDLTLDWTSYDYRVVKWKLSGRAKSWLHWAFPEVWVLRFFPSMVMTDTDLCVSEMKTDCQNISEWAVPDDFDIVERECAANEGIFEPESIAVGLHPD